MIHKKNRKQVNSQTWMIAVLRINFRTILLQSTCWLNKDAHYNNIRHWTTPFLQVGSGHVRLGRTTGESVIPKVESSLIPGAE